MFRDVMVAFDGSPCAEAALKVAAELVRELKGHCTICHVLDFGSLPLARRLSKEHFKELRDELYRFANSTVEEAKKSVAGTDGTFDTLVVEGKPAEALVNAAVDSRIGLIVMGSHGRTGLNRMLLGSVAESVSRVSPIPVLTVHARG